MNPGQLLDFAAKLTLTVALSMEWVYLFTEWLLKNGGHLDGY
jgi:hypothetical protein